MNFDLIFDFH